MDSGTAVDDSHFDYCPWDFDRRASAAQRAAQQARQRRLTDSGASLGPRCFVSPAAGVFSDALVLGENSYIAGHAYVTGELTTGADCTVNPFATVRGRVTLGHGVRIGAHSSLLGFNHGFAPDQPVFRQDHTSKGIIVGDDVWIGSNVVVLDGVTIGDHCVIGAGAVVTHDLPTGRSRPATPPGRCATGAAVAVTVEVTDVAVVGAVVGAVNWAVPSRGSASGSGSRPPRSSPAAGTRTPATTPTGREPPPPSAPTATPSRSPTCSCTRPRRNCPPPNTPNACAPCRIPAADWCPSTPPTAAPASCPRPATTAGSTTAAPSTTYCPWATRWTCWTPASPIPSTPHGI